MNKTQRAKQLVKYKTGMLKLDNARNAQEDRSVLDCIIVLSVLYIRRIGKMRSAAAKKHCRAWCAQRYCNKKTFPNGHDGIVFARAYKYISRFVETHQHIDASMLDDECHLALVRTNKHYESKIMKGLACSIIDNDVNFSYPEANIGAIAGRVPFPVGVSSEKELIAYVNDNTLKYAYPGVTPALQS